MAKRGGGGVQGQVDNGPVGSSAAPFPRGFKGCMCLLGWLERTPGYVLRWGSKIGTCSGGGDSDVSRVGRGARGRRPAPRAPRPRAKSTPRAPRPRAPPPKRASRSRAATHPAQLSRIAGCVAHSARARRRHARHKFRDGRVAATSSGIAGPWPQVPGWPAPGPARSPPRYSSLSGLSAAQCTSKQLLLLAPIPRCACRIMRRSQIIHYPT